MGVQELRSQVRRKLAVTYKDDSTDDRIDQDLIPTAQQELTHLLGIDEEGPNGEGYDFSTPGTENMLFLAYCFYAWHDAEDDFESNYAMQIARCREKWMVRQHAKEEAAPQLQ